MADPFQFVYSKRITGGNIFLMSLLLIILLFLITLKVSISYVLQKEQKTINKTADIFRSISI